MSCFGYNQLEHYENQHLFSKTSELGDIHTQIDQNVHIVDSNEDSRAGLF